MNLPSNTAESVKMPATRDPIVEMLINHVFHSPTSWGNGRSGHRIPRVTGAERLSGYSIWPDVLSCTLGTSSHRAKPLNFLCRLPEIITLEYSADANDHVQSRGRSLKSARYEHRVRFDLIIQNSSNSERASTYGMDDSLARRCQRGSSSVAEDNLSVPCVHH